MARPRSTLTHRGYLWAQKRVSKVQVFEQPPLISQRRMQAAEAWVAGYKAAQNDAREKRRDSRK
jgi:hypothetical protein